MLNSNSSPEALRESLRVSFALEFASCHCEVSTKRGLSAEFAHHLPNLVDGGIPVVIDVDKGVRPEPLLQFLPRHHVARALQQDREQLKWLAAELELDAILAQLAGSKINLECLETN